jgi:ATP-dependent exoDNAse (exonuclease V) beta subunit
MQCASGDDRELVTEGVIDAAVRDSDGWWLVDWKTDDVDGSGWERRRAAYERQIGAYERMVASLTGEPVAAALLQRLRVAGENG